MDIQIGGFNTHSVKSSPTRTGAIVVKRKEMGDPGNLRCETTPPGSVYRYLRSSIVGRDGGHSLFAS